MSKLTSFFCAIKININFNGRPQRESPYANIITVYCRGSFPSSSAIFKPNKITEWFIYFHSVLILSLRPIHLRVLFLFDIFKILYIFKVLNWYFVCNICTVHFNFRYCWCNCFCTFFRIMCIFRIFNFFINRFCS